MSNTSLSVTLIICTILYGTSCILPGCQSHSTIVPVKKVVTQATPEELSQMNKDFAMALVAKDARAAAILYAENATLLPPNEPIVKGRNNIEKYWQRAIDAGLIDASVATISTGSDGELGYEIGRFELKMKDSRGKIIIDRGKYTELLRRDSTGKWISIYGMWNGEATQKK